MRLPQTMVLNLEEDGASEGHRSGPCLDMEDAVARPATILFVQSAFLEMDGSKSKFEFDFLFPTQFPTSVISMFSRVEWVHSVVQLLALCLVQQHFPQQTFVASC